MGWEASARGDLSGTGDGMGGDKVWKNIIWLQKHREGQGCGLVKVCLVNRGVLCVQALCLGLCDLDFYWFFHLGIKLDAQFHLPPSFLLADNLKSLGTWVKYKC